MGLRQSVGSKNNTSEIFCHLFTSVVSIPSETDRLNQTVIKCDLQEEAHLLFKHKYNEQKGAINNDIWCQVDRHDLFVS